MGLSVGVANRCQGIASALESVFDRHSIPLALSKQTTHPAHDVLCAHGTGLAVFLRFVLLFGLVKALSLFQDTLFSIDVEGLISGNFNLHGIVVFVGGIIILYTAVKEISHMIMLEEDEHIERKPASYAAALFKGWPLRRWLIQSGIVSISSILILGVFAFVSSWLGVG